MRFFIPRVNDCGLVTTRDSSIGMFESAVLGRGFGLTRDPHSADVIVLFERWQTRFRSYGDTLAAEPLVQQFWQRIVTVNYDDVARGFLPGLYTSLTPERFDRRLHRACGYPYQYNEIAETVPVSRIMLGASRDAALYSFRGTDKSHPVRKRIAAACNTDPRAAVTIVRQDFHSHDSSQRTAYVEEILQSKFVLCPRGHSPASYRLFETLQLGRAPVIISDDWIRIDGVPWDDFALFVPEGDVASIGRILRAHEDEAADRGRLARQAYEAYFSLERKFDVMLDAILDLVSSGPFSDYRRRWRSAEFKRANGWLLSQRIRRRLDRMFRPMAG